MRKLSKKIIIFTLIYTFIFVPIQSQANRIYMEDITYAGEKVFFDALPFVENNNTLVPMRPFLEAAGADVSWDQKNNKVIVNKGNNTLELKIGEQYLYVNGQKQKMNVKSRAYNGRTYIPLRVVAENLDSEVIWDGSRGVEIRPKRNFLKENPPKNFKEFLNIQTGQKIILGDSISNLKKIMGEPKRIDVDMTGHQWYIYNNTDNTYRNYIQFKIIDGKVEGLSTQSKNWITYNDFRTNNKYNSSVVNNYTENFKELGYNLLVFKKDLDNTIQSIEVENKNHKSYYDYYPNYVENNKDLILKGLEAQVFDHTNAFRVGYGLKPLKKKDNIYDLALEHSHIISQQGQVKHSFPGIVDVNKKLSNFGRKHKYSRVGEVLAGGAITGNKTVNLWCNSPTHRQALLSDFDYTGVAAVHKKSSPHGIYITQNLAK